MLIRFRKGVQKPYPAGQESGSRKAAGHGEVPVFRSAEFKESSEELCNPGCGWYHIYTFRAQPPADGRPVEEEAWLDESCQAEQLALALIDIGDFRMTPISGEALLHIRQVMEFFHKKGKQLLVRFVYDTEGKGMEKEPLTLAMVKRHMEQAAGAVRPSMEDILVWQGIFVGNWGEMHGSKFLDEVSMRELAGTLYRVTEGRCFLAVRTPAQWRRMADRLAMGTDIEERLALFNDGIFGSATDLGTYGIMSRTEAGETGSWSRQEELEWQRQYMDSVPNGGEILSCMPYKSYRHAAEELAEMHVSYLNSIYQPEQLDYWRSEKVKAPGCWQGLSGYDYIGRHLGYRFLVQSAAIKENELLITIRNCGFANLCQEAECFLVTEGEAGRFCCRQLDTDARNWKCGQEFVLTVSFSREEDTDAGDWRYGGESVLTAPLPQAGGGPGSRLYLLLRRKSDGRILRFANQGADEKVPLGEFPKG